VYALLRVPERWERVKADRRLITPAIEETLRLDSPIMMVMRTCPHATQFQSVEISAGSRVLLGLASANHDETVWDDPEQFVLDRPKGANHLAFGFGPHFCLGAELARSQARIMLETLFERLPQLRLADTFQYEPAGGAIHRGPKQLHVCW
jgi:cytochrome P450